VSVVQRCRAQKLADSGCSRGCFHDLQTSYLPELGLALFDSFFDWYPERVAAEQGSYEVVDPLSVAQHAAAVLTLRSGSSKWRQVALSGVRDSRRADQIDLDG